MRRQISEDELFILYAAIGESIWNIQNVEDSLHIYVVLKTQIKRPGSVTEDEAVELLSKQRAHPLGRSMGIAEKGNVLSESLFSELKEFKDERDWLIHRSIQHREELYIDGAREKFLKRIEDVSQWAMRIQNMICQEMVEYGLSVGIPSQRVIDEGKKILDRMKGIDV